MITLKTFAHRTSSNNCNNNAMLLRLSMYYNLANQNEVVRKAFGEELNNKIVH